MWAHKPPRRKAVGWVWLCNSPLCWVTSGMTFVSRMTSHSAWGLALAAGRSTTGQAEHSLHQPRGESGSDRLTHPTPEDHQRTTEDSQAQKEERYQDFYWITLVCACDNKKFLFLLPHIFISQHSFIHILIIETAWCEISGLSIFICKPALINRLFPSIM